MPTSRTLSEPIPCSEPVGGTRRPLLGDGTVLVAGGYDLATPLATAELYDPLTGTFSATGSMNVERWRHTETLLNDGTVLIVGGADDGGALASAEIYVVPEPSALALVVVGLLCGCGHGWCRDGG